MSSAPTVGFTLEHEVAALMAYDEQKRSAKSAHFLLEIDALFDKWVADPLRREEWRADILGLIEKR